MVSAIIIIYTHFVLLLDRMAPLKYKFPLKGLIWGCGQITDMIRVGQSKLLVAKMWEKIASENNPETALLRVLNVV